MTEQLQYYDNLETREPEQREREQFKRLAQQITNAQQNTTAYAKRLEGFDPALINDRAALAQLPITRKSELTERQKTEPPFGGYTATATGELARVFVSPGPIFEPEARCDDYWRTARALFAAGFQRGDLVHNTFAYHLTPAGAMFESGALALGCTLFPAGTGHTEQQVQAIAALRPQGYIGTPSFLRIILEKGRELKLVTASLKKALVSGEALTQNLRDAINAYGIQVLQCYVTADLGLIAYESDMREGLIVDEDVIVEIVRPGTGDPVPQGEVGEVVVTTFNEYYPLIRFATGDLSATLEGTSPCGRTNMRIKGWMGRADQTTKVKGMFVHPSQVAQVVKRHPEIRNARMVVDRDEMNDMMTLQCEVVNGSDALAQAIGVSIRDICQLRGEVEFAAVGTLPNDGKVIDDVRSYD